LHLVKVSGGDINAVMVDAALVMDLKGNGIDREVFKQRGR
jgi:hypothetical protein